MILTYTVTWADYAKGLHRHHEVGEGNTCGPGYEAIGYVLMKDKEKRSIRDCGQDYVTVQVGKHTKKISTPSKVKLWARKTIDNGIPDLPFTFDLNTEDRW